MTPAELEAAGEAISQLTAAFHHTLVGQISLRTNLLVTLLAEGHVLLESVPGPGQDHGRLDPRRVDRGTFSRVQCTPDLLPSDIVGTQVYDPSNGEFDTRLGPVHANFVLLDEINRASAKTQSATLEAMQERQTSIGGVVYPLPSPFMVLATQNPIEEEGTYPLPQAQLDRFLLKEVIEYPSLDEEVEVLRRVDTGVLGTHAAHATPRAPVVDLATLGHLIDLTARVYVDDAVKHYAVALAQATRSAARVIDPELAAYIELGASPRASIVFQQAGRARAILEGRGHVTPDDVRALRYPVLRHRLRLGFQAIADHLDVDTVIDALFAAVPTP